MAEAVAGYHAAGGEQSTGRSPSAGPLLHCRIDQLTAVRGRRLREHFLLQAQSGEIDAHGRSRSR